MGANQEVTELIVCHECVRGLVTRACRGTRSPVQTARSPPSLRADAPARSGARAERQAAPAIDVTRASCGGVRHRRAAGCSPN